MRDERLRGMWRSLGVFLFFVAVQILVSAVAGAVAAVRLGGQGLSAAALDQAVLEMVTGWSTVLVLCADGLTVAGLLLWNRLRVRKPFLDYTSLRRPLGAGGAALCVAAGVTACFWFSLALNLLPWPEGWMAQYADNAASLSGNDALSVLAVTLVAPCCEELVFRGRIYDGLTPVIPAGAATVLQAVLFGGMHDGAIWMCYAFVLGCVLGYLRKLTGSLRAPLLLHAAFNASSYLFDLFAGRWGDSGRVLLWTFAGSAALFLLAVLALNNRYHKEDTAE